MQGKSLCQLIANKSSNIKCVDFKIFLLSSVHCTRTYQYIIWISWIKVLVKLRGQWVGKSQDIIKKQFLYLMIYKQYANVDFFLPLLPLKYV